MDKWNDIENEKDIEKLIKLSNGFHDGCIVSMEFQSGIFVDEERRMSFPSLEEVSLTVLIHTQWIDKAIELCFIGVRQFHVSAFQDNYFNDIFDAYLSFQEGILPSKYRAANKVIVFSIDFDFDAENLPSLLEEPGVTYIISEKLKWRFTEKST